MNKILKILNIAWTKARTGGIPFHRQIGEMFYYFFRYRLGPGYYLMARFWRPEVTPEMKAKHWNGKKYLRFVHAVNDQKYYKISQNKLAEKALLLAMGLPTAKLLGLFHPRKGQDVTGRQLCSENDLNTLIGKSTASGLFFKPAEGDSGRGVFGVKLERAAHQVNLIDMQSGERVSISQLAKLLEQDPAGYIVEETIRQHEAMAAFNASSVNTLRMWVVDGDNGPRVVGAFLRVGRAGSVVDNTAAGGLACAIDLDSGRIVEAMDLQPERNHHRTHPDTGALLWDAEIPYWDSCKTLACNALRILPGARFVGMDVAVTADGPVVVEYNVEPSYQGAAHFDRPHEEIFAELIDKNN